MRKKRGRRRRLATKKAEKTKMLALDVKQMFVKRWMEMLKEES